MLYPPLTRPIAIPIFDGEGTKGLGSEDAAPRHHGMAPDLQLG
jgi:hypothetical protein